MFYSARGLSSDGFIIQGEMALCIHLTFRVAWAGGLFSASGVSLTYQSRENRLVATIYICIYIPASKGQPSWVKQFGRYKQVQLQVQYELKTFNIIS